ncbi:hypothetical protein [Bradyrhizobium sp. STM 3557]|uniref:hypothetical protein n=1 Tax=Bradyrhizobium sp. STM 3557 TaxID=578920 RepID=UPI00388DD398
MIHGGILGALTEANEIQQELGCSFDEAFEVQRKRAAERIREAELEAAESNVIPLRRRASKAAE